LAASDFRLRQEALGVDVKGPRQPFAQTGFYSMAAGAGQTLEIGQNSGIYGLPGGRQERIV